MATHSAEALKQEERRYLRVFIWLGVLTAVELWITTVSLPKFTIGCFLVVLAATKASLVALYYMHLANEKRTLMYIALTPAIICVWLVLMLSPDLGSVRRLWTTQVPPAAASQHAHHD
ncbi:MAG TPA: cytochrome C oxidase subunit IV family protein [Candidatus Binatia bacterium]|nr:cytochrome C oxidase subunit IV family protein [Candidatus Binatia bacterium]